LNILVLNECGILSVTPYFAKEEFEIQGLNSLTKYLLIEQTLHRNVLHNLEIHGVPFFLVIGPFPGYSMYACLNVGSREGSKTTVMKREAALVLPRCMLIISKI